MKQHWKPIQAALGLTVDGIGGPVSRAALLAAATGIGFPVVVKADGLAAGKGVIVCHSQHEAFAAVDHLMTERAFGAAGDG